MIISYNNKILGRNNLIVGYTGSTPVLPFPSDMHFVYVANDYDGDKIPNLATNSTLGSFNRTMNPKMTTFWAGYGSEYVSNAQFYGAAGIARATTAEEDNQIKSFLMTQGV